MVALSKLSRKGRRRLRIAAIFGVSAVSLGSLTGAALGRYTVDGMNPYYSYVHRSSPVVAARENKYDGWVRNFADRVHDESRLDRRDGYVSASYAPDEGRSFY